MAQVIATGELEGLLVGQLREQGWTVLDDSSQGSDLDLEVAFAGIPGRVRLLRGVPVPDGAPGPVTAPSFVRVDLGEPSGPPDRWGALHVIEDVSDDQTASLGYQAAAGGGWASVAVGTDDPQRAPWRKAIPQLLIRVEALRPGARSVAMFHGMDQVAAQRGGGLTSLSFFVTYVVIGVAAVVLAWALRGWQVGLAVLMLALVGRMVVATASHLRPIPAAGHATFGEPGEPIPWDVRVPASVRLVSNSICLVGLAGCCTVLVWKATVEEHWCVPVAILLLGVVVAVLDGVQRFRDKAASDRGWASPFLRTLRSSGIFTKIRVEEERPFLTLPGLRMAASGPEPSGVHLKVRSLTARSTATRATLTLSLWRYAPPDGTPAECRVLPPRWVTLSVTSEEAVLGGLPAGPRRRRHEGRVIWVLSGTELDRGELDDLIGRVGATLGGLPSAPYR